MICANCSRAAEKMKDSLTMMERVFLLTSTATMMKWLHANPNAPAQDKQVASSVATKVLLSFPEEGRAMLLQQLRQSAGVDIVIGSCPHGVLEVV